MMGGIEQGICYTTFMEDVEEENQSMQPKAGMVKSHGFVLRCSERDDSEESKQ